MEDVLALVCLKIATQKSIQMSLIWVTQKGIPVRKVNSEFTVAETVHMGGEPVPFIGGTRRRAALSRLLDRCSLGLG